MIGWLKRFFSGPEDEFDRQVRELGLRTKETPKVTVCELSSFKEPVRQVPEIVGMSGMPGTWRDEHWYSSPHDERF